MLLFSAVQKLIVGLCKISFFSAVYKFFFPAICPSFEHILSSKTVYEYSSSQNITSIVKGVIYKRPNPQNRSVLQKMDSVVKWPLVVFKVKYNFF